jgi:membrane-associated protease RseP (regulator of RpoE activity)
LAIFNILPIPALDWWRILTTIIMHLWRFDPKKYLEIENYINIIFFGLLMWFGFYIMYLDFVRFY